MSRLAGAPRQADRLRDLILQASLGQLLRAVDQGAKRGDIPACQDFRRCRNDLRALGEELLETPAQGSSDDPTQLRGRVRRRGQRGGERRIGPLGRAAPRREDRGGLSGGTIVALPRPAGLVRHHAADRDDEPPASGKRHVALVPHGAEGVLAQDAGLAAENRGMVLAAAEGPHAGVASPP